MTDLQKEFEATGYTSWINLDLYPNGKIYTQEYTEWLEKQVQALRVANTVGQSEQELCCFCKQHPTHEKYWLCKQCIDDYNREKQSTCH
jgi:hypothetical protein